MPMRAVIAGVKARNAAPLVAPSMLTVSCPVFVAGDLSGFRSARKGGGRRARRRCCRGYGRCGFGALLDRRERGELNQEEAGEMLGISERTFRDWRDRRRDEGRSGLIDRRIGKPSSRPAAREEILCMVGLVMLGLCEERYAGFTVKRFHEQMTKRHNYKLGHRVTRLSLHAAGLVRPAPKRSAHRRQRHRRALPGMMPHQDASRFAGCPARLVDTT